MSDDEFDTIPDEFANIQGIDWASLLSSVPATSSRVSNEIYGRSPFPEPESRSSAYFSDGNSMDPVFLAELDLVEQRILYGEPAVGAHPLVVEDGAVSSSTTHLPDVEDTRTSRHVQRTGVVETNRGYEPSAKASPHPHHISTHISSSRSGKAKASELHDILSAFEDELTCPICCDLLVAAHIGNPCGHTFCGECGWQWHVEKKNKGCPCCRQALDMSLPMIPNIAIDNTVEKHVRALAISGESEWEPGGRKYLEWLSRKKSWRRGAQKRETRKRPKAVPIEIFDPPDEWLDPFQDSDVELIPRPIRRARRRQQATTFIQSGTTVYELM